MHGPAAMGFGQGAVLLLLRFFLVRSFGAGGVEQQVVGE